jgi:hypothetical protein
MAGDRRAIPEPLLLVWYVGIAPICGAVAGAAAFEAFAASWVPLWLHAAGALLAGAAGLLAGGILGSFAPRSIPPPRRTERRRIVMRRVLVNAALVLLVMAAVGAPSRWTVVAFSLAVLASIVLWRTRHHSYL